MTAIVEFESYDASVAAALDQAGAAGAVSRQSRILVKPNLVGSSPPPVTTPPEMCRAVIRWVRRHAPQARIVIGEGTGSSSQETDEVFRALGYEELAADEGVELVDLNHAELVTIDNPGGRVYSEMHMPAMAMDCFLVSVPVLKAHSLATVTGALKNMMGILPPAHYAGSSGWKKGSFHARMQASLMDMLACRAPDLSVMDATVGLRDYHLGGPTCDPPVNRILASLDGWDLDRAACQLLGIDWESVQHVAVQP